MFYNEINGMTPIQPVKRNLTMHETLTSFTKSIVSHYAKYDHLDNCYVLELSDLPDFDLHKFAALIMREDDARANESTGCDNNQFYKTMLPALITFLNNSTDRDEAIEFMDSWREGVTAYHKGYMKELIKKELETYNVDQGCYVKDWNDYYGVTPLFASR